jgi:phospholipase/carboxylesterase
MSERSKNGPTVGGEGPHAGQPILTAGAPAAAAEAAIVLLHGRGATANGILGLGDDLDRSGVAYVAPQAARSTWYPYSFMAPVEQNQPNLDSALDAVDSARDVVENAGVPPAKTVLLGFSQGACLASEYAIRNPGRYGGVVALSGGLIGPPGTEWEAAGEFDGTPVFFGCSDRDPHIPESRVHESAAAFTARNADVTERIYDGMGHTVNADEMEWVRSLVDELLGDG